MATTEKLQFIIEAEDNTKKALNSVKGGLESIKDKVENLQPVFGNMAKIGTAAFAGLSAVIYKGFDSLAENEYWYTRMANVMKNTTGATEKQIKAFRELADVNEKTTTISAEATMAMLEEASSYGWTNEQVKKFLPTMNDFVGLMAGVNPTAESAQQVITGLGKASNGYAEILTKKGFILTETQKKTLELGDSQKSLAILTELLGENYGGLAQELRNTTQGQMFAMKTALDDIGESIATAVLPHLTNFIQKTTDIANKINEWAQKNPELAKTIVSITIGLTGLTAVIGLLGMALPSIIAGIGFLTSPIGLLVLGLTALVALFFTFKDQIMQIFAFIEEQTGILSFFKDIWAQLSLIFTETLIPAFQRFWEIIQPFLPVLGFIAKAIGVVLLGAIIGIIEVLKVLIQMFTWVFDIITKIASFFIDGLVNSIQAVIDKIKSLISFVKELIANLKEIGIGGVVKSIGGKIKGLFGGGSQSVNDAIISPNGNIITTHPDDYIMAMKDPSLLAGGGGGITINISGNSFMGKEDIAEQIGNDIMKIVKQNMKL